METSTELTFILTKISVSFDTVIFNGATSVVILEIGPL